MPRHDTGLGARGFAPANKRLQRYEQDRTLRIHQQKVANAKHQLDVKKPKRYAHLLLRLKQIQKEEERQAEIDHENKLLLNKMTHTMKYGGNIDNWNNYESRSLNYPLRERLNDEIAKENLGIARRLETVKPKLRKDMWDKDFRKHQYLQQLLNDSTKDYGEWQPRRYSRMSKAVKKSLTMHRRDNGRSPEKARSLDASLDETLDDETGSEVPTGDKKRLPRLGPKGTAHSHQARATKSESGAPTKLPKIDPSKKLVEHDFSMYRGPDERNKTSIEKEEDGTAGGSKADESDVAQLFRVAKQMEKPDDVMFKTLIKKSHKQRMQTKVKFRQKYDLDLITELKNGLGVDWEHLIDALLQERGVADSYAIFDALSAQDSKKTSDVSDVVELLCSRDNAAIGDLKESYRKEFSISLEEDIADRTKEPVQTLLLALQKGHSDESTDIDTKEVWADSVALHESGEGRWTSESGKCLKLLTGKSAAHLQAVLAEYKAASGGLEILEVVKEECPRDYHLAMRTLVNCMRSPETYFANKMYKNKLPTNPVFVTLLVTRSEVDMPAIRRTYKKLYEVDIVTDIKSKHHATTRCLTELASKVPPGARGKETAAKKTYTKPQPVPHAPPAARKTTGTKKQETSDKQAEESKQGKAVKKSKTDDAVAGNVVKKTEHAPKERANASGDNPLGQPTKRVHAEAAKQRKQQEIDDRLKEDGDHNGTVKPISNFNPDSDCDKLNSAMSGIGTDEKVIVEIIPHRSNKQRQELKKRYEQKFKKNLMIDLESELRGDFEEIVLALMMTPLEYDAYCIHEAVEGLGTSEATLIGILCTRNGKDIKAIKEQYKKAYKTDMDRDITSDLSGDFEKMILELCKGERDHGVEVDMEEARRDAKALHKDGEISIDPNAETFKAIMAKKHSSQVRATFEEYKKLTGHDVYTGITKAMMGDDEDGYIALAKAVEDPVQFYAERLNNCFSGLGTNDNMLIRIIVSRSEIDLKDIKGRFYELYGKTISDTIQKECSGDYKSILLAILADKAEEREELYGNP